MFLDIPAPKEYDSGQMTRAEQLRLDRGEGIEEAALAARIAPRTLRAVEAGAQVRTDSLYRLATYYGVPTSTLQQPAFQPNGEAAA